MKLLHFHIGSQISDIAVIKDALQEASQIYVELCKLGAPMQYIDVGGGLGIDFDGTKTSSNTSTNYSLCLLYPSPSPRDRTRSRMPSSA